MTYTFIAQDCPDLPVATCCRVMKVSSSGFYTWRTDPVSQRDWDDAVLTNTIVDIHGASRRSYGSPRVHAELRLGEGVRCSRKRVERLMRQAGIVGIHRRRGRGCTRRDPDAEPAEDLVNRAFDPTEPDRLWMMDITEHPTGEGKVYLAVVLDAFSRLVVGWSMADHIRAELVVDALQMATWRRQPPAGQTVAHSDHGAQYTSWASVADSAPPACWVRWAPSATASTTASSRASSARCSSSCSTNTAGRPANSSRWPSSSGSSAGTTHGGGTPTAPCSAPSTTKPPTLQPLPRHDSHSQPVRRSGGSSLICTGTSGRSASASRSPLCCQEAVSLVSGHAEPCPVGLAGGWF